MNVADSRRITVSVFRRPMSHCPACGSSRLDPVVRDEDVTFVCDGCAECWRVEHGHVRQVPRAILSSAPQELACGQDRDHAEE